MREKLLFKFETARNGKPLVIVKNFPGLDAELYADELLTMAQELTWAANQAKERDGDSRPRSMDQGMSR